MEKYNQHADDDAAHTKNGSTDKSTNPSQTDGRHSEETDEDHRVESKTSYKESSSGLDNSKQKLIKYGGAVSIIVLALALIFIPGSRDEKDDSAADIDQSKQQSNQDSGQSQDETGSALGDSFEPGRVITEEDRKYDNIIGRTGRHELLDPNPNYSPPRDRNAPLAENPVELDERAEQASYVFDEVVHDPIPQTDQFFNVRGRLLQHAGLEADETIQDAYLSMYYADSSHVFATRAAKPEVLATEEAGVYEVIYPVAAELKPLPRDTETKKRLKKELESELDTAIQSNKTVPVTFVLDFNKNEASINPERWWQTQYRD